MSASPAQRLTPAEVQAWLRTQLDAGTYRWWTDPERHLITGTGPAGETLLSLRPPLPWPPLPAETAGLPAYLSALPETLPVHLIVLIQVGACAMGVFEGEEVLAHKAFKKYMKRHKQGRSQLDFAKSRGKSRAGSRIRLANAVRFFEEINERLTQWEAAYAPQRLLYSCAAPLWGALFQSRVSPPFDRKDLRLVKIPRDVRVPDHEELLRIQRFGRYGYLSGPALDADTPDF